VGTDYSLCIAEEIRHPHIGREVAPFHCVKRGGNTLEINLYELTAPFECCVLEMEQLETWGNSLRF
jgi:hypothetical protein